MKRPATTGSTAGKTAPKPSNVEVETEGFKDGYAIKMALSNQHPDSLRTALNSLRKQLTVKHVDDAVASNDPRLMLAKDWLDRSPGARELFEIWDSSSQQNALPPSQPLSVMTTLLTLLNNHFIFHPLGIPIIKTLLSGNYLRRLNSYAGGSQNELIMASIRLWNAMTHFAGGQEKKAVLDAFPWHLKSLPKLLVMRRKSNDASPFERPDIRTQYISFVLSFLAPGTPLPVKMGLLDHRDIFLSLFKDMHRDHYLVVQHILEVCWEGLWNDHKIRRTTKVMLFAERTLQQISKLYERSEAEDSEERVPADLAHHFLLAICTRPGVGICFKERGWYPKRSDDGPVEQEDEDEDQKGPRINNRILNNFIQTLQVVDDSRQQELALKILEACPELITPYWNARCITLEPRLTSRWIANIAYAGKVVSLPISMASFTLPSGQFNPLPPPLVSITTAIIPSTYPKLFASQGLQSPSRLVRYLTANFLVKCLQKLTAVMAAISHIQDVLGEEATSGAWASRRRDLTQDIMRKLPDFKVVVALLQAQDMKGKSTDQGSTKDGPPQDAQSHHLLIREATLRLMRLYHHCLPELVAESKFDVGKLLLSIKDVKAHQQSATDDMETDQAAGVNASGIVLMSQLHVLRLLAGNDQIQWSTKLGDSSQSALFHILHIHATTPHAAIRQVSAEAVIKLLSQSLLFEHDPMEVEIWLEALPRTRRRQGTTTPDGTALTDEISGFLVFFDECLQRCLKTPYRYLEESLAVFGEIKETEGQDPASQLDSGSTLSSGYQPSSAPSPLLFTMLEQFRAKTAAMLLSPSDALAVATFFRIFIINLTGKQPNMRYALHLSQILLATPGPMVAYAKSPLMIYAINREWRILHHTLSFSPTVTDRHFKANQTIGTFLDNIEATPEGTNHHKVAEIIDWLRLVDTPLGLQDVLRLCSAVMKLGPDNSDLRALMYQLSDTTHFWSVLLAEGVDGALQAGFSFVWGFVQAGEADIRNNGCVKLLKASFVRVSEAFRRRSIQTILHRIHHDVTARRLIAVQSWISLLTVLLSANVSEKAALKVRIFSDQTIIRLCQSPERECVALGELLRSILNQESEHDRNLAGGICTYWCLQAQGHVSDLIAAQPWIVLMSTDQILSLLDLAVDGDRDVCLSVVEATVSSLRARGCNGAVWALNSRLPSLLRVRYRYPVSSPIHMDLVGLMEQVLPLGHIEHPSMSRPLSSMTIEAEERWGQRANIPLPDGLVSLNDEDEVGIQIATILLYRNRNLREPISQWIASRNPASIPSILPILHAFLDTHSGDYDQEEIGQHFPELCKILFDRSASGQSRTLAARCINLLVCKSPSGALRYRDALVASIGHAPASTMLDVEILDLCAAIRNIDAFSICQRRVAESGLTWIVRRFAEDPSDSPHFLLCLAKFSEVLRAVDDVKVHIAEPVLTAIVQHRLAVASAVAFATDLFERVVMKPANVNRLLQSVLQSPSFASLCNDRRPQSPRASIIKLLVALFKKHPSNTCQPSHIVPLISIYHGTQSLPDQGILYILDLFERTRKVSATPLLTCWSSYAGSKSGGAFEAVRSLDPNLVLRTFSVFPQHRTSASQTQRYHGLQDDLYDPVFIISLLNLCSGSEHSGSAWVDILRTNAVSLCISGLSSKSGSMRAMARITLARVYNAIQAVTFQEGDQAKYILARVKATLGPPGKDHLKVPRLPTYTTLLLAHALRCVFYPSSFLYPLVSKFLLQRPYTDQNDVPMLYNMLYSSSEASKVERTWMLRYLADGMVSSADWRVLKRRHTWDLLATMFSGNEKDKSLRRLILGVFIKISSNREAVTSLVLRSGLLTWVELQTPRLVDGEESIWLKMIDNIVFALDQTRLDQAWLSACHQSLLQSLAHLVKKKGPFHMLFTMSKLLFKLKEVTPALNEEVWIPLLEAVITWLRSMESSIASVEPDLSLSERDELLLAISPPHQMVESPEPPSGNVLLWGLSIEMLWQAVMMQDTSRDAQAVTAWNNLTPRLLIWRHLSRTVGGSEVAEWGRRQVQAMIQSQLDQSLRTTTVSM